MKMPLIPVLTSRRIQGDEFSINVVDQLKDKSMELGLSIVISLFCCGEPETSDSFFLQHWHGIFQHHTNYVDGPSFITQCPLVPEESFLYKFNALSQAVNPCNMYHKIRTNPLSCYPREHFGITAISEASTVMGCVAL